MDQKQWNEPATFRPERFLDEEGHLQGKDRVVSFSLGMTQLLICTYSSI